MPDQVHPRGAPRPARQRRRPDGRRDPRAHGLRACDGLGRVLERGRQPARPRLPRAQAGRARRADPGRGLPARVAAGEVSLRGQQLLRRRSQPPRRRARQGLAVARRAPARRRGALSRPAGQGWQQPDRRAAGRVCPRRSDAQAEQEDRRAQLAGQGPDPRPARAAAARGPRLSLPRPRRRHGCVREGQGGQEAVEGGDRQAQGLAQAGEQALHEGRGRAAPGAQPQD
ncbi:hypothetical protein ENSA5_44910 [Enhygromyxa salina]|uniref:Uncharacterized protein n=1 Tax=Enhygromyxa salina TaxID=215803 RepID=A0A2S9XJU3_9BACT|nr:hypothetical protein ENSA5_44910 [Enhygromyxa salina]